MQTLISEDLTIVDKLADAFNKSTKDLLNLDSKAIAQEFLSIKRAIEQIELFKSEVNKFDNFNFTNKKLLEIGAGVGTHLIIARKNYNIEAFGIEPSNNEFSAFEEISASLLKQNGIPENIIVRTEAENISFPDNNFDLIYSTNVLEHVKDPKKVISESIRVLRSGGYLQFVIPNYFSFWEGHYGIFWPCITNKSLAKLYVKLIQRNPKYVDTLNLISPSYLRSILKDYPNIQILGWGKELFKSRLETGNYSDWASLQKIRQLVQLIQKLKVSSFAANILNVFEMYTPIVLTLKKIS